MWLTIKIPNELSHLQNVFYLYIVLAETYAITMEYF